MKFAFYDKILVDLKLLSGICQIAYTESETRILFSIDNHILTVWWQQAICYQSE